MSDLLTWASVAAIVVVFIYMIYSVIKHVRDMKKQRSRQEEITNDLLSIVEKLRSYR